MRALVDRTEAVPSPAYDWSVTHGPWLDNNLAVAEVTADGMTLGWFAGEVRDERYEHPRLRQVARVTIE